MYRESAGNDGQYGSFAKEILSEQIQHDALSGARYWCGGVYAEKAPAVCCRLCSHFWNEEAIQGSPALMTRSPVLRQRRCYRLSTAVRGVPR